MLQPRERSVSPDVIRRAAVPRTQSMGRRKAVMRYDEKTEIEATGEWLLRFNEAGFSDELMYVPSQLSKLGVAPIDVVDWLKQNDHGPVEVDQSIAGVVAPEEPVELEVLVEALEDRSLPGVEIVPLVLDYDRYGAWEWAEPIEKMVEDAIVAIFNSEPDLPGFNELASLARPKQRARGKRARAAAATAVPLERANELVSSESVSS